MRPLTHGTQHATRMHRAAGEPPCLPCAKAEVDRQRLRRAATCDRMQLPVELITELYLSAPLGLQVRVDAYLSTPVVDVLIGRHDTAILEGQ